MREMLKESAPYISFFGLVLLAASLFVPALARQTGTELPERIELVLAVVGLILMLAWPLLRPEDLKSAWRRRQTRFGGNVLVLVLAVLAILVAINFLSTRRYYVRDLTANQMFTVSPQTVQILEDLSARGQAVTLTAVLPADDAQTAEGLERLVEQYRRASDQVSVARVDPLRDRPEMEALKQRLDLGQAPPNRALVAESGGRHAIVYSFDEQAVTEAIVKATRERQPSVVFTSGHGEHDPNLAGQDGRGYTNVKAQLEREGYTVETRSLATLTGTLEADVVVVAGPQRPFLPREVETLAAFRAGGGGLMLMLDPNVEAGLDSLLSPYEVRPQADLVLQPASPFGPASVVVTGEDFPPHAITRDLASLLTVLVATRSFIVGSPITATLSASPLANVSGGAWGETDLEALQGQQAEPGPEDSQPPLTLAVATEGDPSAAAASEGTDAAASGGRMVVFGTSAVAADTLLQQLPPGAVANFDLFLNAVGWLAQDEALISIRPKEPESKPLTPPQSPLLLFLLTTIAIPLAIFGVGASMWWRRR